MHAVTGEKGSAPQPHQGIAAEMALMLRRGREVWRLVPRKHKWALADLTGTLHNAASLRNRPTTVTPAFLCLQERLLDVGPIRARPQFA